MEIKEICPCPNLDCPNHGYCDKCTSRHLRLGYLNYCGFQTILPFLREVFEASPDSPSAQKLLTLIDGQSQAYVKLMEKHGLIEKRQENLTKAMAEYSDH